MCGRYSLAVDPDLLRDEFDLDEAPQDLAARYNIAPTEPAAVITNRDPKHIRMHHFGLIPHWADEPSISHRMINARRESLADKPAFRDAYRRHRCLVIADGFYEWQRRGRSKQPYHVRLRSRRPFGFAGLWTVWRAPDGTRVPSCTIITAPAEGALVEVHDRMPVIIPRALRAAWLEPAAEEPDALAPLLEKTPLDALELYPVGAFVNTPGHEGLECVAPLA